MSRRRKKNTAMKIARSNRAKLNKLQPESKVKTGSTSNDDVNTTGAVILLSGVARGDTLAERNGQEVSARRIFIRGYFANSHGTPEDCLIRIVLFRASQPGSAIPTLSGGLFNSLSINAMRDLAHLPDYKIYYDHTFSMDTTQHTLLPFKINKLLSTRTRYNGIDAADETATESNHYYLAYWSTVSGTTNDPLVTWEWRFSFVDA